MKVLSVVLVLFFFFSSVVGQKTNSLNKSPDNSKIVGAKKSSPDRYTILVSTFLVIKLDTFTGKTESYSTFGLSDKLEWIPVKIDGLPDESSSNTSKYRMSEQKSDEPGQYNFYLINGETGQTWISRTSFKSFLRWEPILAD